MLELPKLSSETLKLFDVTNPEEGPDFLKRAEKVLGETQCRRVQALREFRKKLDMVEEFTPKVDDDRFLLRFLRARKFNVEKAYRLMCNFYKVRLQNPSMYVPVGMGPKDFAQLYDLECGTILQHRNPKDGTAVIICRFGKWRPATGHGPLDIYTPAVYAGEMFMDLPEVQVNGFSLIFDLQGLEYSWLVRYLTPDYVSQVLGFAQESYPLSIKKVHILNQSYLWNIGFAIGKPFVPPKLRNRFYLHGSNMESLHEHISREILPEEYGGLTGPLDFWFLPQLYAMHDRIVENSYYGYDV